MEEFFLFYKYYNRAWGIQNFSCVILQDGRVFSFTNEKDGNDIFGFYKNEILPVLSVDMLKTLLNNESEFIVQISNKPIEVDIKNLKLNRLEKDQRAKFFDRGYELYALFKFNAKMKGYEYIPLQILDTYYYSNQTKGILKYFKPNLFKLLINKIDEYRKYV